MCFFFHIFGLVILPDWMRVLFDHCCHLSVDDSRVLAYFSNHLSFVPLFCSNDVVVKCYYYFKLFLFEFHFTSLYRSYNLCINISLQEWETLVVLIPFKKNDFRPAQNMCPNLLDETATTICVQCQIC